MSETPQPPAPEQSWAVLPESGSKYTAHSYSRPPFHRSVTRAVDQAQEAFDWYRVEAWGAAQEAIRLAEQIARAQVPCNAEDRRVRALQINTYVSLYKAFRARANDNLGAAMVHLERASANWDRLTVIAARW